jgi:ppGpp synthetase/RelA/SpoT-type nucleotidyltranferase
MPGGFTMSLIDDFISRYTKEYDFYYQAGRLAAQKLESSLREAGVRSIVTDRAKSISRLREKCQQRDIDRGGYTSIEEIYEDIVDLAGVRIALYFPAECDQVDGTIVRLFNMVGPKKEFPDPTKSRPGKRFSGYSAAHYRVQLKEQDLNDSQKRYATAKIEIQVASVLMHAWAEVEHDLVYKPLSGDLSEDELAILDELNGMVLAGEIALESLQRAGEARVAVKGRKIANHYDLAVHLLGRAADITKKPISEAGLGRVDILFDLLKKLGKDTAELLAPYLEALHDNVEIRPLADQITDALLAEDPSRYETYDSVRRLHFATAKGPDSGDEEFIRQFGLFMSRWIELEGLLRELEITPRLVMPTRRQLADIPLLDGLANEIDRLRHIRNNVVHGIEIPPADYLAEAAQRLEEIVTEIKRRRNEHNEP